MDPLYLLLGGLLLVVGGIDILWTTLWVEGSAGPLTARLMEWLWQGFRRVVGDRPRLLTLAGPAILVAGLAMWLALLWAGWTLVFAGGENALVDTRNTGPISWTERAYFVGYSIFTLGNGDFTPQGGVWRLATVLATASGMLFVTLIVTYVLSVLGAVTQKRSFASGVTGLGGRSVATLRDSWDGEEFRGLDVPLDRLSSELDTLTSNHKAYPILHYFHTADAENAPAVGIVVLDELLTVLRFGAPDRSRPSDVAVNTARSSVENYLETLQSAFVDPADRTPPPPDLDALREAGVPTASDEAFESSLAELDERRRQLLGLVESDSREWPNGTDE